MKSFFLETYYRTQYFKNEGGKNIPKAVFFSPLKSLVRKEMYIIMALLNTKMSVRKLLPDLSNPTQKYGVSLHLLNLLQQLSQDYRI